MNLNGIGSVTENYTNYADSTFKPNTQAAAPSQSTDSAAANTGVVYEKSDAQQVDTTKQTYKPNTALVEQLKADAKARQEELMSYVQQMMGGQGNALAQADDIWKTLASGNFTVDELARKKAQEAISEDGYWGVNKTSDRIIEMAKALSGGDPSKIDTLRKAFTDGFNEATKTWGQKLPDISSQTYDAVMKKFDDWAKEGQSAATATDSAAAATDAAVPGVSASTQA